MLTKLNERAKICNWVCALQMFYLLLLHFTPYWCFQGSSLSIGEYVLFPKKHIDLLNWLNQCLGNTKLDPMMVNEVVSAPIIVMLASIIGIVLCILKANKFWPSVLSMVIGIGGFLLYRYNPYMDFGVLRRMYLYFFVGLVAVPVLVILVAALEDKVKKVYNSLKNKKKQ